MHMNRLAISIFLCAFIFAGCSAGKDYTYEPPQESPAGPGLFSGKAGFFAIYGEQSPKNPEKPPGKIQEDKAEQSQ
jgi:hypothetical protein